MKSNILILLLYSLLILFSCHSNPSSVLMLHYPNGKIKSRITYEKNLMIDSTVYDMKGNIKYIDHIDTLTHAVMEIWFYENNDTMQLSVINTVSLDAIDKKYYKGNHLKSIEIYANKTKVYTMAIDSIGNIIDEGRYVSIYSQKDTVRIDGYYNATVKLWGPQIKGIAILYGNCFQLNEKGIDIPPIDTMRNMIGHVHIKTRKIGKNVFSSIIRVTQLNGKFDYNIPCDDKEVIVVK